MSATLTPEERTLRARVAAFAKHAKHDPAEQCAAMRAALWQRYLDKVDPSRSLAEPERERRARALMRADLARHALAAARRRQEEQNEALADALVEVGA